MDEISVTGDSRSWFRERAWRAADPSEDKVSVYVVQQGEGGCCRPETGHLSVPRGETTRQNSSRCLFLFLSLSWSDKGLEIRYHIWTPVNNLTASEMSLQIRCKSGDRETEGLVDVQCNEPLSPVQTGARPKSRGQDTGGYGN